MVQDPQTVQDYIAARQAFNEACGLELDPQDPLVALSRERARRSTRAYIADLKENDLPVPDGLADELRILEGTPEVDETSHLDL